MFQKTIQFLKEVRIEMKKVTWPTRSETSGATAVVIVITIICGLYLFLCDVVLSKGMEPLFLRQVNGLTAVLVLFLAGIIGLIFYTTKK